MTEPKTQGYQPRRSRRRLLTRNPRPTVWNTAQRTSTTVDTIGPRSFVLLVVLFTLCGIGLAVFAGSFSYGWELKSWGAWIILFFVGLCLVTIGGTKLYIKDDRWYMSALGYALVAGPFGFAMGPVVSDYTPQSVINTAIIATIYTVAFGIVGALIPRSLEEWNSTIAASLLVILGVLSTMLVLVLMGIDVTAGLSVMNYVILVAFGFVVMYDMRRTMLVPRTLDKAIDCAGGLFTDMLVIFQSFLPITGQRV